jgi:hypothetical protein
MSLRTVIKSTFEYVDEISSREFRVVAFVCIIIAALNALIVAYSIGYGNGRVVCGYPCYFPGPREFSHDFMRVKIELAFLVIATALWFRRVMAFCISLVAALFIDIQYAFWYLDTQRWLREMHVSNFSQLPVPSEWPHFAGIYQATPWDFVLLAFTSALLVWQVRVLVALITSTRRNK